MILKLHIVYAHINEPRKNKKKTHKFCLVTEITKIPFVIGKKIITAEKGDRREAISAYMLYRAERLL